MNDQQYQRVKSDQGFADLDQSGGSTPNALKLYGIDESAYSTDAEMFDLMHAMRSRIITSPSFDGDHILGAILFEQTMDRTIDGRATGEYLWDVKHIVPFVKVDKGLDEEADGVQLMTSMPDLDELLSRGVEKKMVGTKMRSMIKLANDAGVKSVVDQQVAIADEILARDLVPIVEPEVDIRSPEKAEAEALLKSALLERLDQLSRDRRVILKLSLPEVGDLYADLVAHPNVLRVVALSGGCSREEANARLERSHGVVASFSRAFTEGLSVQQSDEELDAALGASIASIFAASNA